MKKILYLILIVAFVASCTPKKESQYPPCCYEELPPGNADKFISIKNDSINFDGIEVAPLQRPNKNTDKYSEFIDKSPLKTAESFIKDTLGIKRSNIKGNIDFIEYLTRNVESMTFIDNTHGFASFSHPPDENFAKSIGLNISPGIGGTDIFEFELEEGEGIIFKNLLALRDSLNSPFWDSHPFAFAYKDSDDVSNQDYTILLWSSDRANPYSHKFYYDDKAYKIENKGNTDIYYAFKTNGIWSAPKKLVGVSTDSASEGSPYVYCRCLNPLLIYSSNQKASKKINKYKNDKIDFDLNIVRLEIDPIKQLITTVEDSTVESFKQNLLGRDKNNFAYEYILIDSLTKKKYFQDSLINTAYDERFPYIYRKNFSDNGRKDTNTYLIFSSNRDTTRTEILNSAHYVKNKGNYDLYKFVFNFPCRKPNPLTQLIVDIKEYDSGELVKGNTETRLYRVENGISELITTSNENPARFKVLKGHQYIVKGGSDYNRISTECNGKNEFYLMPKYKDSTSVYPYEEENYKSKEPLTISMNTYNEYLKSKKVISKTQLKYDYKDCRKYYISENITYTPLNLISTKGNDSVVVTCDVNVIKQLSTAKFKTISKNDFANMASNDIDENRKEVLSYNVPSIRTLGNSMNIFNVTNIDTIRDEIILEKHDTLTKCVYLTVILKDKSSSEDVKNPVIILMNADTKVIISEQNTNKADFEVNPNKRYMVFGGSRYKDELCSTVDKMAFIGYVNPQSVYNANVNEIIQGASVSSELTKKYLNSIPVDISADIYDTVYLSRKYETKPPCSFTFNRMTTGYKDRVPYFQTAFWEVNTSKNLNEHLVLLRRSSVLQNTSPWHQAKWIELHWDNSRYGINGSMNRDYRIMQYKNYANAVDNNLNIIQDTISRIFNVFEKLKAEDKSRKFIIEVQAWSDLRPVQLGFYNAKNENEKVITYAECEDFRNVSPSSFNKVTVNDGDSLGYRNEKLSQLRAYFGSLEVAEMLKKIPSINKYINAGRVLTPTDLIKAGKLLSKEEINKKMENAEVIILTKGYNTDCKSVNIQPNKSYTYEDCQDKMQIAFPNYQTKDLDSVRSLYITIRAVKYQNAKIIKDPCCSDYDNNGEIAFASNVIRKSDKMNAKEVIKKNAKAVITNEIKPNTEEFDDLLLSLGEKQKSTQNEQVNIKQQQKQQSFNGENYLVQFSSFRTIEQAQKDAADINKSLNNITPKTEVITKNVKGITYYSVILSRKFSTKKEAQDYINNLFIYENFKRRNYIIIEGK